jgi:hypothetical protein
MVAGPQDQLALAPGARSGNDSSPLPPPCELITTDARCVIAYARISDLSGKRGDILNRTKGVTNQQITNQAIARREELTIVKYYADNDLSASKDQPRPGFEAMLVDLRRGFTTEGYLVHGVIAVDEDRIFKTPTQWERFVEAFRTVTGRVFADYYGTKDLYDEEAQDAALLGVETSMRENRKRKAQTRRWHEAQARRGIAHTGGRAFGYKQVPGFPGAIEVVAEEAALIRQAVAACIAGKSWGEITRIFTDSSIPTRGGGPWRIQTVKQIISSPRNAGLRMIDGEVFRGTDGQPVIGQWEAIIAIPEWESVIERYRPRERLPGGNTKNPRRTPRKYLLSGLLRCGSLIDDRTCNTVMMGSATTQGKAAYRYSCRPRMDGGCSGTSVNGEWIDSEVSELVFARVESRPICDEGKPWPYEEELAAAVAKRDEFESRWTLGLVPDEQFYRLSPRLNDAVNALFKDRAEYVATVIAATGTQSCHRERWWKTVEEGGYDLQRKRAILAAELDFVLIFPVGKGNRKRDQDSYRPVFRSAARVPWPARASKIFDLGVQ